jgi:HEAT repeat protein
LTDISHAVKRRVPDAVPSLATAVPVLTTALSDESNEVRCLAVYALGAIGTEAVPAAIVLRRMVQDPDDEVREATKIALGLIEGGDCL